jgi:DNA polymerase III subunit beta
MSAAGLNLSIKASTLAEALKRAAGVVDQKANIPILRHVRLTADGGGLTVRACDTNRELAVTVEASVEASGDLCLPAAALKGLMDGWWDGSAVTLRAEENGRVAVASGRSRYKLANLDAADFPYLDAARDGVSFTLPGASLARALGRASWAASDDESRFYLAGVYLHADGDNLMLVATDGKAMSVQAMDRPEHMADLAGVIIPNNALPILTKLAEASDVTLTLDPGKLSASAGDVQFVTKLVDGTFPDYRRVLPESSPERSTTVDRVGLLAALRRLEAVSDDGKVNLTGSPAGLTVANWRSPDSEGVEDVEAEAVGELACTINRRWLAPALASFEGDHVLIEQRGNGDPVRITSTAEADAGFTVIVMPAMG